MFRKRTAPSVGEIKVRHVEQEHGIVPANAWSKNLAQRPPEIGPVLFGFRCVHCLWKIRRCCAPHHQALAGFFSPSFEGGRKSGGERVRLLEFLR